MSEHVEVGELCTLISLAVVLYDMLYVSGSLEFCTRLHLA